MEECAAQSRAPNFRKTSEGISIKFTEFEVIAILLNYAKIQVGVILNALAFFVRSMHIRCINRIYVELSSYGTRQQYFEQESGRLCWSRSWGSYG